MKSQSEVNNWDNYWNSSSINRDIMQVWGAYFARSYEKNFGFKKSDVVLDFGAGFGNVSYYLKGKTSHIYLYDKSDYMSEVLRHNFKKFDHIDILESLKQIDKKVNIIIINSVLQYMTPDELKSMLNNLKSICDKHTRIIISDIIPNNYSKLADFLIQLWLGLKFGFFSKLMVYAISNTFFSPSMSLSTSYLTTYDEDEIISILNEFQFTSEKMKSNFTLSKKRYTLACYLNPNVHQLH